MPNRGPKPQDRSKTPDQIRAYIKRRSKPNENGCWIWQGPPTSHGYAGAYINFQNVKVHRLSYSVFVDDSAIPVGYVVHHECEVKNCVNPKHLRVITNIENTTMGTRKSKQRKLTIEKVREIRALLKLKPRPLMKVIGLQYRVTPELIGKINAGKIWKELCPRST